MIVLTKVNRRQQNIVLVTYNGTIFYTPPYLKKNYIRFFHLYTLKLSKAVLSNIPLPSKFKPNNYFEVLTGKLMGGSCSEKLHLQSYLKMIWSKTGYFGPLGNNLILFIIQIYLIVR